VSCSKHSVWRNDGSRADGAIELIHKLNEESLCILWRIIASNHSFHNPMMGIIIRFDYYYMKHKYKEEEYTNVSVHC